MVQEHANVEEMPTLDEELQATREYPARGQRQPMSPKAHRADRAGCTHILRNTHAQCILYTYAYIEEKEAMNLRGNKGAGSWDGLEEERAGKE